MQLSACMDEEEPRGRRVKVAARNDKAQAGKRQDEKMTLARAAVLVICLLSFVPSASGGRMSKFATFLVFVFGVFVMIAIAVIFTQRTFFPAPPAPPEEQIVIPECTRPSLEIGTREQFGARLSKLAAQGGLEAVKEFVEKEIVPGRALLAAGSASEPETERLVLDRELRSCDSEGVTPLNKPPLVPRASAALRDSAKIQIQTWPRLEGPQPFMLTIWWVAPIAQ
jgi:hypothetical protein